MNIVDSCAWLAFFADEPNARYFLPPLQDSDSLIVPSITIYEVFRVVMRELNENEAIQSIAAMQKGLVVDLTSSLAITAAKLGLKHNLPMADSIILATAHTYEATIWTQDSDFDTISGVKYFPKI